MNTLFKQIDPAKLAQLMEGAEEVHVPANITFLREGDPGDVFYMVKSGSVQIFSVAQDKAVKVIARETAGGFFGEQALLSHAPGRRNANVRTLTDCVFLAISHQKLRDLLQSEATFKKELQKLGFEELLDRFKSANADKTVFQTLLDAADSFETRVFKHGEAVSSESRSVTYFVLSGKVDIYATDDKGAEVLLSTQMPKSFFALQSTTARAKGVATVLVIPNEERLKKVMEVLHHFDKGD